jgi:hypothetical protein
MQETDDSDFMFTNFSALQLFRPPPRLHHHGLQDVGTLHIDDSDFTCSLELQLFWALARACRCHCRLQDVRTLSTDDFGFKSFDEHQLFRAPARAGHRRRPTCGHFAYYFP